MNTPKEVVKYVEEQIRNLEIKKRHIEMDILTRQKIIDRLTTISDNKE